MKKVKLICTRDIERFEKEVNEFCKGVTDRVIMIDDMHYSTGIDEEGIYHSVMIEYRDI